MIKSFYTDTNRTKIQKVKISSCKGRIVTVLDLENRVSKNWNSDAYFSCKVSMKKECYEPWLECECEF